VFILLAILFIRTRVNGPNGLTNIGRRKRIHPNGRPIKDNSETCTAVCNASNNTGSSTPLRADLEMRVTEIAQAEWNKTVAVTFSREGGGEGGDGFTGSSRTVDISDRWKSRIAQKTSVVSQFLRGICLISDGNGD
jgi:hypothetical protein